VAAKTEILRSVPGVGKVLSSMLLAKLPELGTLNRKQLGAIGRSGADAR
jgi:transposase